MPSLPPVHRPFRIGPHKREPREVSRGSSRQRGYTAEWDRAAKGHLRLHPLCLGCEAVGVTAIAVLVDHVEPHKGDMVKFWNRGMWQSACRWHHDVVKPRLEAMMVEGTVSVADLWLNSTVAIDMTSTLRVDR